MRFVWPYRSQKEEGMQGSRSPARLMRAGWTATRVIIAVLAGSATRAADSKPNILILWRDDIGQFNVSAYNQGMMGYKTPNIDRIAKEGKMFTDWYGQQSCTAGRAAFI